MVKVSGLADYRSRRHEPRDFDAEVSRVEAEVEGHSPPDWVLLLCGRGLPHGRTVATRIELRQADPPSGHISVHTVGEINFDRDDPLPVDGARADTVMVYDGFPCRLIAVRRPAARDDPARLRPRGRPRGECGSPHAPDNAGNTGTEQAGDDGAGGV